MSNPTGIFPSVHGFARLTHDPAVMLISTINKTTPCISKFHMPLTLDSDQSPEYCFNPGETYPCTPNYGLSHELYPKPTEPKSLNSSQPASKCNVKITPKANQNLKASKNASRLPSPSQLSPLRKKPIQRSYDTLPNDAKHLELQKNPKPNVLYTKHSPFKQRPEIQREKNSSRWNSLSAFKSTPTHRQLRKSTPPQQPTRTKDLLQKQPWPLQERFYYHYELPTVCALCFYEAPELLLPPRLDTSLFNFF